MKLTRFVGERIHGFLDKEIKFKEDTTFITGINGSGKTTIINSIIALITPSMDALAAIEYKKIRIEFKHEKKRLFIESSKKNSTQVILRASRIDKQLVFDKFMLDPDIAPYKEAEYEEQYYSELTAISAQHPVMEFIASLPTPMFLGLDRRSRFAEEDIRYRRLGYRPGRTIRGHRNVFGGSLAGSLGDAAALAENSYRTTLISVGSISQDLRRDMLLRLLTVEPTRGIGRITGPEKSDVQEIKAMRRDVEELPRILDLPPDEVTKRILPFLELLENYAEKIPDKYNMTKLHQENNKEVFEALVNWSVNKPQLKKIQSISEMVSKYNKYQKKITDPTFRYLNLLNRFLQDSGKKVKFDEQGYILFTIDGFSGKREITSLSSGEAQIFVILTHLFFNPKVQGGNVFIIDEPELSLHVQWQELFVDSIREANPDIQYILATHSPSIILEKIDKCIDISRE